MISACDSGVLSTFRRRLTSSLSWSITGCASRRIDASAKAPSTSSLPEEARSSACYYPTFLRNSLIAPDGRKLDGIRPGVLMAIKMADTSLLMEFAQARHTLGEEVSTTLKRLHNEKSAAGISRSSSSRNNLRGGDIPSNRITVLALDALPARLIGNRRPTHLMHPISGSRTISIRGRKPPSFALCSWRRPLGIVPCHRNQHQLSDNKHQSGGCKVRCLDRAAANNSVRRVTSRRK